VTWTEIDAFDLPEWLGELEVTWSSDSALGGVHLVSGHLEAPGSVPDPAAELPCDLLAVDLAYPAPVLDEATRTRVHQVWRHGQVLVLSRDGRPTLATPGTSYDLDEVLEALTRLAQAVGADPTRWSVRLGLGAPRRR
jgi:hypothetical protein